MATPSLAGRLARLPTLTAAQLRHEYATLYGETTRSGNRSWLAKRVAWRMQRLAHGGLSPAALARADELAEGADLRLNPPPGHDPAAAPLDTSAGEGSSDLPRDPRLPALGTVLTRPYKGTTVLVEVRRDGFLYRGELYPSLSAAAKAATGCHLNGFRFFRLAKESA